MSKIQRRIFEYIENNKDRQAKAATDTDHAVDIAPGCYIYKTMSGAYHIYGKMAYRMADKLCKENILTCTGKDFEKWINVVVMPENKERHEFEAHQAAMKHLHSLAVAEDKAREQAKLKTISKKEKLTPEALEYTLKAKKEEIKNMIGGLTHYTTQKLAAKSGVRHGWKRRHHEVRNDLCQKTDRYKTIKGLDNWRKKIEETRKIAS